MPKLNRVVQQLQSQRKKAEQEIQKLDLAIRALSSLNGPSLGGFFGPSQAAVLSGGARQNCCRSASTLG